MTAGTIFDKTRTSLRVWFAAACYITNQKQGVSALGLQRVLGLNSYQTAWAMLHRFRRAMVRPNRDLLCGTVEVDEVFLALSRRDTENPKPPGSKSHNRSHLAAVAVAIEVHEPKGFWRIRLQRIAVGPNIGAIVPLSRSRGLLFYRLIQQSAVAAPATYANIRDNHHPSITPPEHPKAVELNG